MKRKIAVILAADVAGFSKLVSEDEEETLRRLAAYRSVFGDFITSAGGRIFNTAGDSILAEFHSAVDAVRCAIDVQETLRTRNQAYPASRQMNFRMGLTMGDVVERDGDLLGDGVNIAARLQSIAPEGGICISRSIHEAVANKLSVKFLDKGMQQLKNIPEPMQAYTVGPSLDPAHAGGNPAKPERRGIPKQSLVIAGIGAAAVAAIAMLVLRSPPAVKLVEPEKIAAAKPAPVPSPQPVAAKEPANEPAKAAASSQPASAPSESVAAKTPPPAEKMRTDDDQPTPPPAPVAREPVVTAAKAPEASEPPKVDQLAASKLLNRRLLDCNDTPIDKAVEPCRSVLDLHLLAGGELAAVQLRLGRALREGGDSKAAIDMLSQSINQKPTAEAYNHRGIAYYDESIIDKSIADYSEAIRLDPKHAEAFNNRAWTRYKSGDLKTALEDADQAVSLLANKSYVWDTRAHIHEALGNRVMAVKDFRQALSLDPANAESKSGLERLGEKP